MRRRPPNVQGSPTHPYGPYPMEMPWENQHFPNQPSVSQGAQFHAPPGYQNPYEQFAKPPQPNQWDPYYSLQQQSPMNGQQQKPPGMMQYFQDKNGQLDLDKMLSTMGQVANTANQFSPLMKGLGTFIKGFKV
ncbi:MULTISPECIES: YppG family protein [Pontibacillus]|uniref:YppG family protein n=1 Tax=Pontibacillus chungwhensis TaxID=265426 RepID=A0ABY8UYV3_9BACI|nr:MULTISPECIES: YppG family protein [Pontibacillus]MCD5325838.1 YppG family protein [Pontibacillus sp. HN14]WIF98368.1 YppG family protein [Pontibacillus chungwhensis]